MGERGGGIQRLIDAAMKPGMTADEAYAARDAARLRREAERRKAEASVKKVGVALTHIQRDDVKVMEYISTEKGSPQDRTNKADARVKVKVKEIEKPQKVNVQVKSSQTGVDHFYSVHNEPGDPAEEKFIRMDLIVLNAADSYLVIRMKFLSQLEKILAARGWEGVSFS